MKFQIRKILLRGAEQRDLVIALLANVPLDAETPLEVVVREHVSSRTLEQNNLLWAALTEISGQAWVDGKQFSADVWHEHLKREYLPDDESDATKSGYRKWSYLPNGDRVLIGSTTQLTKRGFADYMERVYAYGAGLGVQFHEREV